MMIGRKPFAYLDQPDQDYLAGPITAPLPPIMAPQAPPQPQQQAGGRIKPHWLGILADALAGAAGQPGRYAQHLQQRQQDERGEANYQRRREDDRSDWLWKQQNESRAPSEFDRMMDAAGVPADQRPAMYRQALERKINPPRTIVLADGSVMELPGGASPFPAVPPRPVGPLTPIDGGPTPTASGGFR